MRVVVGVGIHEMVETLGESNSCESKSDHEHRDHVVARGSYDLVLIMTPSNVDGSISKSIPHSPAWRDECARAWKILAKLANEKN